MSKLQTVMNHSKVLHLKEANKLLEDAATTADTGLVFKGGVIVWNKAIMPTVTDASWANEKYCSQTDGRL